MAEKSNTVDGNLGDWSTVKGDAAWPSLLIGNGASIAVCQNFNYGSLFNQASLSANDKHLFSALDNTTNFELVLDALRVSELVCHQLGHKHSQVSTRYKSIRNALIAAVNQVHIPWIDMTQPVMTAIGNELLTYTAVYSTNYDLVAYWSLMSVNQSNAWGDLFWNAALEFDDTDTQPFPNKTLIHYLHGGLHLYRTANGGTAKRAATAPSTLLNLLGTPYQGTDLPLFVSEGRSADKMRIIRSSDYLSFAYGAFEDEDNDLVVFGNSLSKQDEHLVKAINRHPARRVAVGLRPGRTLTVIKAKAAILGSLKTKQVRFFNSETHPLGSPALQLCP